MDSAEDRYTGQVIDGEQLWYISPVDKEGYVCRGCGVMVNPVSFERHHKKRPHFKDLPGKLHEPWCDVNGEVKLIAEGKSRRLSTADGFPGSFPSRLELVDSKEKVDSAAGTGGHTTSSTGVGSSKSDKEKRHSEWTARTIRPICRTYMNYPNDRDLRLNIAGMDGGSYDEIVRKLAARDIVRYPTKRILAAPLGWQKINEGDNRVEVGLSYGFWANGNLLRRYRLVIDTSTWSSAKKRYILNELETSQDESKSNAKAGRKSEKSWVFFMGEQNPIDPADFIVTDHRLVCCLTGELK